LTAYVDQQLIGKERERVESHLAKCDSCLEQVGFLIKQSQLPVGAAPSSLVQRAKELETAVHKHAPFRWEWVSVAAASAVIALGLLLWREMGHNIKEPSTIIATAPQPLAPAVPATVKTEADTAVRSVSPPASLPLVLSPQPGAIVQAPDFTIRWKAIPNAAAYEVRIVTAEGDLVWRKRVRENSVNAPTQTLRPGLKYFVWVRVWLANGVTQQSAAVGFIGG
jgi:anti-sigma factor RsiW